MKKPAWWWRINILQLKSKNYINESLEAFHSIKHHIYFIDAWEHSEDMSYIQNHNQEIKKLFHPNESVMQKISNSFGEFNGYTIGVHIFEGETIKNIYLVDTILVLKSGLNISDSCLHKLQIVM